MNRDDQITAGMDAIALQGIRLPDLIDITADIRADRSGLRGDGPEGFPLSDKTAAVVDALLSLDGGGLSGNGSAGGSSDAGRGNKNHENDQGSETASSDLTTLSASGCGCGSSHEVTSDDRIFVREHVF